MRTPTLVSALLCAALALPAVAAHASTARDSTSIDITGSTSSGHPARAAHVRPRSNAWEAKVLKLTNARRKAHGRAPLKAASCADKFAEPWTRHMAKTRNLVHQDLRPMLRCPHTHTAGENIAFGFETPSALVSAWMHSAGHRANILNPHFHRIGVSGWRATNGLTFATQDFLG